MICVSGTAYKDLHFALLHSVSYETVVFLGFEITLLFHHRDGSRFYRVRSPGFPSVDLNHIPDVFYTVLRLYDSEHP